MNKVILMGRLTRDPEVRYTGGESSAVARYTLAVDRRFKKEGGDTADFIQCVAFGKSGEFAEKYFKKGTKVVVEGRIQTGSYEKDGQRIYTTDVVVEQQEFAESKASSSESAGNVEQQSAPSSAVGDGFQNIPDAVEAELPFA
ncbi:MAG: single-stranded DNA-binding protein [Lachnospiraceae bacterium]|nr:single-stranded DNA-binding protein [Lachnospiraceae bacterium]